ncbi:MAG: 2-oxoacid:acceptor oxidoreductase subunit alpha [Desulfotalea sp.]
MVKIVNDFVIRFSNVNGSGSASANNLFAKAIFRMGIPVSPKNIFPSNIQGMPTWYEVRVSEKGYLGRGKQIDFAVEINGKVMEKDYKEIAPAGYFLYDSTKPLTEAFNRDDVTHIGIPLTELARSEFPVPRLQQILKNIIYVGSLAYLLEMDFSVLVQAIENQFTNKQKLIDSNIKALKLGYNYAKDNYQDTCHLKLETRTGLINDNILINGNTATGLGAVYGGATFAGWYPITPSTSVVEAFENYCKSYRVDSEGSNQFAILQAEDELSAIGMVIGASWNGARSFTATSGPGLSLMGEFLGLAYFAEIPAVLIDVQRAGPSTGMPTRTQQSDVLAAAFASHGDTRHVLLFPSSPAECFEHTALALDLAEELQTPIMILSDLDLGMNDHISAPLSWQENRTYKRGKVITAKQLEEAKEKWGRYLDVDKDGICYRSFPGCHPSKGAYFTRGTSHNEYSGYTEDSDLYVEGMKRLMKKWETTKEYVPKAIAKVDKNIKKGIIYYGSSQPASQECLDILATKKIELNNLRITAFPFSTEVQEFLDQHEQVFVIEQNREGQMRTLLNMECKVQSEKLTPILQYHGMPLRATDLAHSIEASLNREEL